MFILGIDVAKLTLDLTLLTPSGAPYHTTIDNTPTGFAALQTWLLDHKVTTLHACMEATNVYWEAIATWLHAHGDTVSVVNPARIKGFAQATMQRTKTDRQDSLIIALFCLKHRPEDWAPSSPEQRHLRSLVRLRHDLIQSRVQQENRLRDTTDAVVTTILQRVVDGLKTEVTAVEAHIQEQIASDRNLKEQAVLLTSIKGIGMVTASLIMAELPKLAQYPSAKAAAADVGVTPSQYDSGTSVHRRPRMSKMGKSDLRAALYLPALTAMRWCPAIKTFADRLTASGKPSKVVIGAVMRKLIHICYGVLKHKTPYDPAKVGPKTPSAT